MLAPRWRVVVALFTVTSCIATAVSTFGVFLPVLSEAFGWSRGAVSVVLSISLVLGGVAAFPVGRIADRRGPRAGVPTTVALGARRLLPRRLAFADARLWFFVTAWCFLGLVFMMVTVHSVSYARDRGLSLEEASLALSAFGIGAVSGRLLAGAAADRFGAVPTMRVCLLIQLAALGALLIGLPTWTDVATLLVFGLGASGADNTFVKAVSDVFGLAALATIMSVVGLGWRSGAGLGPALAGFVYHATSSYTPSFAFAVLALTAGWALFRRGRAPRRH